MKRHDFEEETVAFSLLEEVVVETAPAERSIPAVHLLRRSKLLLLLLWLRATPIILISIVVLIPRNLIDSSTVGALFRPMPRVTTYPTPPDAPPFCPLFLLFDLPRPFFPGPFFNMNFLGFSYPFATSKVQSPMACPQKHHVLCPCSLLSFLFLL